jgi:hypothetical protein
MGAWLRNAEYYNTLSSSVSTSPLNAQLTGLVTSQQATGFCRELLLCSPHFHDRNFSGRTDPTPERFLDLNVIPPGAP